MKYIHDHPRALALTIWIVIFTLVAIFGLLTSGSEGPAPDGPSLPTYTDPTTGAIIPIPEGMRLHSTQSREGASIALFSFSQEDSPIIFFSFKDVWPELSESHFTSRKRVTNDAFSSLDIANYYKADYSTADSHAQVGNWSYHRLHIPENTRMYCGITAGPTTVLLRYHYGYRYEIWLSNDNDSKYLAAMDSLVAGGTYPPFPKRSAFSSLPSLLMAIPASLVAFHLPRRVYRHTIKKAPEITWKVRAAALIRCLFAYLLIAAGCLLINLVFPLFSKISHIFGGAVLIQRIAISAIYRNWTFMDTLPGEKR